MWRALILCFALLLPPAPVPAPLTVRIIANVSEVAPGQSVNYTIDVRGNDPLGHTVFVYVDVGPGLNVWEFGTNGDFCSPRADSRVRCVGTVRRGAGLLVFVSARSSTGPRCVGYRLVVLAVDPDLGRAEDVLTLPVAQRKCSIALPLLQQ
jgi:hypothetical protein